MIYFFSEDTPFQLKQKIKHKRWLSALSESHNFSIGDLNFIFCSDEHLYKMNVQYLSHDTYTDIITFGELDAKKIHGDLFISVDRIRDNAKSNNTSFELELARVMAHGVLHIIGYKDKSPSDALEMRAQEEKSLILYDEYVVCST
ncbi:MAG: rRNA maturation RNase YbeY [Flavobacteriales bacterium]|nr:rRNA maturation RNase YbeY [Flavobacteriales bacterium]